MSGPWRESAEETYWNDSRDGHSKISHSTRLKSNRFIFLNHELSEHRSSLDKEAALRKLVIQKNKPVGL